MTNNRITLELTDYELDLLITTIGMSKDQLEQNPLPDQLDIDRYGLLTRVFNQLQKSLPVSSDELTDTV